MAYSAGQLSNLRNTQHSAEWALIISVPDTLLAAQINDGSIERGQRDIAWDSGVGAVTDVRSFQEVWVGTGAGKDDVGRLLISSITGGPVTGTLNVYEHALALENDLYLTFKRFFPVERVQGRFYNQVFYKFYSTTYSSQNRKDKLLPVVRGCYDRVGELVSGSCAFSVDFSDSYALASGASISSYSLSVQPSTGITVTAFNTSTGVGTITATQTGEWWAIIEVTDSEGNVQELFFRLVVWSQTTLPYIDVDISGLRYDRKGGRLSFTVFGDVTLADIPDRTPVILWHRAYFDGVEGYVSPFGSIGNGILFSGYTRKERNIDQLADGSWAVTIEAMTPDGVCDNLPMRNLGLRARDNPSQWWHFDRDLFTTGRAVHHWARWHSTLLHRHELIGLADDTALRRGADFEEGSLRSGIDMVAFQRGQLLRWLSDPLGRLWLAADLQFLNDTDRDAADTLMDIEELDVSGEVTIVRDYEAKLHTGQLSGFAFNTAEGSPFISIIPGYRTGGVSYPVIERTGGSLRNWPNQLIEDQTDSNERLGRVYAYENRQIREIRVKFRGGGYASALTTIPNWWYRLDLAGTTLARQLDVATLRMLCTQINMTFRKGQTGTEGEIDVEATFEPEVEGPDAIQGNYPTSMPDPPTTSQPSWDIDEEQLQALLAAGSIYYRDEDDTDWTSVNSSDGWTFICIDPWWAIKKGGNANPANVIYWALDGSNMYRANGISGTPVQKNIPTDPPDSFADTPDPTTDDLTYVHLAWDRWIEDEGYVLVEAQNGSSEYRGWIAMTTNGGDDWTYGDLFDGAAPDEIRPIWLALNGTYVFATIWEKDGATEKLWLVKLDKTDLSWQDRYDLGVCTSANLFSTYEAYPVAVLDDDNYYAAYGRMASPGAVAASSDPEHIIDTDDDGSTWASVENGQGAAIVKALEIDLADASGDRIFSSVTSETEAAVGYLWAFPSDEQCWTLDDDLGCHVVEWDGGEGHDALGSVYFASGGSECSGMSMSLDIDPVETSITDFSFWYRYDNFTGGDVNLVWNISYDDGSDDNDSVVMSDSTSSGWLQMTTISLNAAKSIDEIRIEVQSGYDTEELLIWIDDVQLGSETDTYPCP